MPDPRPALRQKLEHHGFAGSPRVLRWSPDSFAALVVALQTSKHGGVFMVEVGCQPLALPREADAKGELDTPMCIFRRDVGRWPLDMPAAQGELLGATVLAAVDDVRARVASLPELIATSDLDSLRAQLPFDLSTGSVAALHLARAAATWGHPTKAAEFARQGLAETPARATTLIAWLEEVLATVEPHASASSRSENTDRRGSLPKFVRRWLGGRSGD